MLDHKDYLSTLNKARRKRNRNWDPRYLFIILGAVALVGIVIAVALSLKMCIRDRSTTRGSTSPA